MFQIGEFSKLVRVSPRMLRYYEKCGLLYPAQIHRETGYRFYSAGQIPLLGRIVCLRDLGFSIDEIGDILPHFEDAVYMEKALLYRESAIHSAITAEQDKLEQLAQMRIWMKKEKSDMNYEIMLKELPKVKVLSLRKVISDYTMEGELWHKLGSYMAQNGIACPEAAESGYSIYWDDDYKERDVDVEVAIPVEALGESKDGFVYRELDSVKLAATLRFAGPYEQYSAVMQTLADWMESNGYAFAGPVRGAAIRTPQDQSDPQNYLTELQVPVRKK